MCCVADCRAISRCSQSWPSVCPLFSQSRSSNFLRVGSPSALNIGARTVFLAGLAVFTAASLLCGAAQSQELLVAARFVQGAGGAMTSAVILGMIVTMFPEPREQAKAIGIYGFVASAVIVAPVALSRRDDATLVLAPALGLLVVSVLAWLLRLSSLASVELRGAPT